jgi:hypothetical protein
MSLSPTELCPTTERPRQSVSNPLPSGTLNLTVNVPALVRSVLSQVTDGAAWRAVGELHRALLVKGLETLATEARAARDLVRADLYGRAAAELTGALRQHYGPVKLAFLLLFLGVTAWSWLAHDEEDLRRARNQRARLTWRCPKTGRDQDTELQEFHTEFS